MWPRSYNPASVLTSIIFTSGLFKFFSNQSVCTTERAKFLGAALEGATEIPATRPKLTMATMNAFGRKTNFLNMIFSL